jgi:hypothetical protein
VGQIKLPNWAISKYRNHAALLAFVFNSIQFLDTTGAWVLRAQPNRLDGYIFELRINSSGLNFTGWTSRGGSKLNAQTHLVFPNCCLSGDTIQVNATVTDSRFSM